MVVYAIESDTKRLHTWISLPLGLLCLLTLPFFGAARALTPSTKDMLLIYGVPAIVNNEKVQKKAADALDGTEDLLRLAKTYVAEKLSTKKEPADANK